nr:immunoglobulin heavy chain junction region [Mus musculus]NSM09547.1 immunoglobulin heavy chain junction region [Mus musculus]
CARWDGSSYFYYAMDYW